MTYTAIDMHVHYYTAAPAAGLSEAKRMFGSSGSTEDVREYYAARDLAGVVFDIDKETTTGVRIDNKAVADLAHESEGRFLGFGSVDPNKGARALEELEQCREWGLRGLKVHPVTQQFSLEDETFYPLWEACERHQLPVLIHTGTTGIGAGAPGGRGFRLKYARPFPGIDDMAASFPQLTIIAAHYAWPWHLDLLAIAKHKGNVYIDLSGWAPKYMPQEVFRYMNSVMPEKFLFGSDYPLLSPERWMAEFSAMEVKSDVRDAVLRDNARRILGWPA